MPTRPLILAALVLVPIIQELPDEGTAETARAVVPISAPVQPDAPSLAFDADRDALHRTVWGEARGASPIDQAAVVHVIFNRWKSRRWGKRVVDVVFARKQFSCWNKGDPNYPVVTRPSLVQNRRFQALSAKVDLIWEARLDGAPDPTRGADHYHHAPVDPFWAKGEHVLVLGRTNTYRLF